MNIFSWMIVSTFVCIGIEYLFDRKRLKELEKRLKEKSENEEG